jgi:hypothetical protein
LARVDDNELPPEPAPLRIPWRSIVSWTASFGVILWAALLLPGVVRDVRERALIDFEDGPLDPGPIVEDPVLSPEVRDLMRRGEQAELDGRLPLARGLYYKAFKSEPRCFSCALKRRVVERRIREESVASLESGAKFLEEARYADAAEEYQRVLNLVPHEKADFHLLAKQGLKEARAGAARAGRPLP